jgi:hypothetical protein
MAAVAVTPTMRLHVSLEMSISVQDYVMQPSPFSDMQLAGAWRVPGRCAEPSGFTVQVCATMES